MLACRTRAVVSYSTRLYSTAPSIKHPNRGGQNLSERHARLARMVRGKGYFSAEIDDKLSAADSASSTAKKYREKTFRGLVIPQEPREPQSDGEFES